MLYCKFKITAAIGNIVFPLSLIEHGKNCFLCILRQIHKDSLSPCFDIGFTGYRTFVLIACTPGKKREA